MSLTPQEIAVATLAGQVATDFAALPQLHPSDLPDVVFHVHAIQSIVMARSAQRAHPEQFPVTALRAAKKLSRTAPDGH